MTAPNRQQHDPTDRFPQPGAGMVLTEQGGVQAEACIPGVGGVTLRDDTIRPIRKEPQMNTDEIRGWVGKGARVVC
jgi:hypothetical protein